jgi:hypothetical protein
LVTDGQELLHDHGLAPEFGVDLQQRVHVRIVRQCRVTPEPPAAVQRLQHHVAVPGAEVADRLAVPGDQGRRLQVRELGDEQLLRARCAPPPGC